MDQTSESEVEVAPPVLEETVSASPPSEEGPVSPNPVKADALRRLKAPDRRGKTVGTHLDELRALLTVLFERLAD